MQVEGKMSSLAKPALVEAFNRQIGHEMGASLQYVSIASFFAGQALPELAKFFYRQADEEREHAMKFVQFVIDVEETVRIPDIAAPKTDFTTARETVALSVEWEKEVTRQIYELVDHAKREGNYIAQRFLDWFVTEQLEEVATMTSLLQVLDRAGEGGLLHVEDYLARGGLQPAAAS
jgi:ferritin